MDAHGRRESSSLGLTDCGSEDGLSTATEALPSPGHLHLRRHLDPILPEPCMWPSQYDEMGTHQPCLGDAGGSPFSDYVHLLSDEQCSTSDALVGTSLDGFIYSMDPNSDLHLQRQSAQASLYLEEDPGHRPELAHVDHHTPVTPFPGPANMFDGVPVQDS